MMNNCFKRAGLLPMLFICLFFSSVGIAQNLKAQQRANPVAENTRTTQNPTPQASTSAGNPHASDNVNSPFDAVKGKKEDQKKRDAYSKHYINEDGSFTALIGAGPIHYEKNGKFHDIEHKITPNLDSNFPYANTTNLFESYFGATSHTGVKNKTAEGEIREFLNTQMYWEVNGQAVNTVNSANKAVRIEGDKAYYDNIYGNISAEFITLTAKRKLNYIIPNKQALGNIPAGADYLVFTEDVVLPFNWTSSITESGVMIKDQLGKEIYLYENPVSTDAKNELTREVNTIFETSQMGNTLTIKTKVKTEWLLSNERVFPVMVDPTNYYPTGTGAYRTAQMGSSGVGAYGTIAVGYSGGYYRGYATFDTSTIPDAATINSIVLNHRVGGGQYMATGSDGGSRGSEIRAFINNPESYSNWLNKYNAVVNASNSPALYATVLNIGVTGWKPGVTLGSTANTHLKNNLVNNRFTIGYRPAGNYNTGIRAEYALIYGEDAGDDKPYITVTYTEPITDRTLTVSGSYGAPANGNHTYSNNASVIATAGTRPGYNLLGWTGTGSVPATGTGDSVTFTITANSTITWNWQQIGTPNNVVFNNYGDDDQLAFNNSRIDTTTPTFRLSHATDPATDYEIEINTSPTFGGTSWTETFTGTYPIGTPANFTFTNSFAPTSGATYYVRARVRGEADVWSAWTTETYSFTYDTNQEVPDWFQTTQEQFQTDTYSGLSVNATNGGEVVPLSGGTVITNGSFENNLTGWNVSSSYTSGTNGYQSGASDYWATDGSYSLEMWNNTPGSTGYFNGDYISRYQIVNLTGVSNLSMDASYEGSGTMNIQLRVYVAETNQASGTAGELVHTWTPATNNSTTNIDINLTPFGFTGDKIIKLVYYVTSQETVSNTRYLNVDNVRTISPPAGTISSTPIHLASVQGATAYEGITWSQTLNGGALTLKVQESPDGINGWTDVAGHTNISATGDGIQTYDLNGLAAPHIRLVGALNGTGVTLHDWSVQFAAECANSTIWDGLAWTNGMPADSDTKIIFEADYTSSGSNYDEVNGLVGCSIEVLADANVVFSEGHHVTIDNEILVADTGSFTLENNASLVQINPDVVNSDNITVKRNTTEMVKFDATYWSSPVAGQNLKGFSSGTLNNRFYIYNGYNAAAAGDSRHFKAVFVNDTNYPMPDPIPTEWEVPEGETTGNLFNMGTYTFKPGWGYSIRVPNNWPHAIGSAGAIWEKTFTGVPHNGDVVVPAFGKYTMVGNPYPSAINTTDPGGFFAENPNVETLHFWTHHFAVTDLENYNSNYVTYTRLGDAGTHPGDGTLPNGKIEIGQGFVVENSSIDDTESQTRWDVVFKNTMRTTERGVFLKQAVNEIERNRYWLSLSDENETKIAQILIGYMTGATYEFDHQIDGRRMGGAPLYSWIGEEKFTVQGRTLPFEVEDVVPLGFKAPEFGKFKIGLDDFDGFFTDENLQIYIRDNFMQVEHDLRLADYWFSTEEGDFPTRFEIVYKIEEVMSTQNLNDEFVKIYKNKENILIESEKEKILSVEVYDLSGRTIHRNNKVNAHIYQVRKTSLATQILVVKVLTEKGDIVTKKVINQ